MDHTLLANALLRRPIASTWSDIEAYGFSRRIRDRSDIHVQKHAHADEEDSEQQKDDEDHGRDSANGKISV